MRVEGCAENNGYCTLHTVPYIQYYCIDSQVSLFPSIIVQGNVFLLVGDDLPGRNPGVAKRRRQ